MRLLTLVTVLGFSISGFAQEFSWSSNNSTREILHTIETENQCAQGGVRSFSTVELTGTKTYSDTLYAGVSSYGDIALVQNKDGKTMVDLYICLRESANGKGQVLGDFTIEASPRCVLGQITAGDLVLATDQGLEYQVKFSPIDIPDTDRVSSLCQGRGEPEHSNEQRNTQKDFEDIPYSPKNMGLNLGSSVIGY